MTKTDMILGHLLTGDEATDEKLRAAFELGVQHGQDADRKSVQRATQIDTTQRTLATLMREQGTELEEAMATIQIPRKDRDIYRRIFDNKTKQKQR